MVSNTNCGGYKDAQDIVSGHCCTNLGYKFQLVFNKYCAGYRYLEGIAKWILQCELGLRLEAIIGYKRECDDWILVRTIVQKWWSFYSDFHL